MTTDGIAVCETVSSVAAGALREVRRAVSSTTRRCVCCAQGEIGQELQLKLQDPRPPTNQSRRASAASPAARVHDTCW